MPRSRSKRSNYRPPPARKPPKPPRWVPVLGIGLAVLGLLVVVLGYVVDLGGAWTGVGLLGGFGLMAAGLVVLTRVR